MKKDIPQHKVEDLAIAIVPSDDESFWDTYVINLKEEAISSVFVKSHGYGEIDGEQLKTTVLRHFFEQIGALQIEKIEPIQKAVFGLTNEYWVSFRYEGYLYDKKYVFVKGSLSEINFTTIPFINKRGVMIR